MAKLFYNFSRFSNLLLLTFIFVSCDFHKDVSMLKESDVVSIESSPDSLLLSVNNISPNTLTGFNIVQNSLEVNFLEFSNKSDKKESIQKKIPLYEDLQVISFIGSSLVDGISKRYRHYYLIDKSLSSLSFDYFEGDVVLKNNQAIIADTIFQEYQSISLSTQKGYNDLDVLYARYKNKFKSISNSFLLLNDLLYVNKIQQIAPLDQRVDTYLKELTQPVLSNVFGNFLYSYAKERFYILDYENLNSKNYSSQYIDLLSKGLYMYMKQIKNDKNEHFNKAYLWLKETNFYKDNKQIIDKELLKFNELEFSKSIQDLKLKTIKGKNIEFSKIVKEIPSQYYIIDFWATWCVPCISEYKILHQLELPQNLKIISLSLDKTSEIEKWKSRAINLKQENTYLIDDATNQKLIKLLEINSIPRYILVDKNFNLIEGNFIRPSETDFLKKLTELTKNSSD